ncbi:ATPase family AAA domain-containing protein 5 [Ostrinia furnacalis]|uniref:ATPase family AAA domain-containing protein 5 n=1 Tax=Ostrinia furnacalis TaxID=93504 RepID=UPI00103E8849|nr:ATPase family AAA domain-containing protein 5 [Ostrinia furnacalis]
MSTSFKTVIDPESSLGQILSKTSGKKTVKTKKRKCVLKSKENILNPQCRRELKKRLKKYKLRRDGQEDQEVLDVSQILVTALKIKSPTSNINSNGNDKLDEIIPKNYLFKMGRRKQIIKKKDLDDCSKAAITNHIDDKIDVFNLKDSENSKITEEHKHVQNEVKETGDDGNIKSKDKKQNAFQLMMESRNKSIGSNSPGKDKVVDESELLETVERKSIKAKRTLLLQKMAEAKGSLKKKEMEEYQEKCIKKKMEKRAERLKKMITTKKPEQDDSDVEIVTVENEIPSNNNVKKETPTNNKVKKEIPTNNNDVSASGKKTLKLVNIFQDSIQNVNDSKSRVKKIKEDNEFLKKLSPSLKKKENMLCYFKKVEKEQESDDVFSSQNVDDEDDDDPVIIKVKMTPRSKKSKKKKLSLNKDGVKQNVVNENDESASNKILVIDVASEDNLALENSKDVDDLNVARPRRNVKRPAKYIDDVKASSSDEEIHIFTPKKKKHVKNSNNVAETKIEVKVPEPSRASSSKEEKKTASEKKNVKLIKEDKQKKPTKLAPIFASKPQLDAAAIEAKQRFLSSGVPERLKKTIEKQKEQNIGHNNFHTVFHVRQKESASPEKKLDFRFQLSDVGEDHVNIVPKTNFFKNIICSIQPVMRNESLLFEKNKIHDTLQKIKLMYPRFPVYRTYRILRDKNREECRDYSYLDLDNSIEVMNGLIDFNNESPDKLNWTDKYKAFSSKQLIGNFECIKELKKWLVSWTENDVKFKKANGANSDSSDFYKSDTDSKDSIQSTNNLLVLNGPVGSGKTSIVYAVAAELAIKVLEVNASSKRTGKIMLQDLQEATQSHKVNRGKSSQESSQKSQEIVASNVKENKVKKRGRPKKTAVVEVEATSKKAQPLSNTEALSQPNSQDSNRTCMSLILIDDADIVFEQDDGFCSAIVQLVHCSKRPVILITSSMSCPHLQRFLQIAKILHTKPFMPRMLGTWLDILCLADTGMCWPGLGAKILDYFDGDIRKSINFLQFNTVRDSSIEKENASQNSETYKTEQEDENSSMSWADRESNEERIEKCQVSNIIDDNIWHYFMKEQVNLIGLEPPVQLFYIWWNVPRLLNASSNCNVYDGGETNESPIVKSKIKLGLDAMSNVADMISLADCYKHKDMVFSLTTVPWANFESHSVSEQENLDKYDRNQEIMNQISLSLVKGSIKTAQNALDLEHKTNIDFPGLLMKRERDKVASRHNSITSYLNPSSALDRRALALDYWSSCRAICRVEKSRTDSNSKRNNRFCHYLKSVNILSKSQSFDNLGDSLSFRDLHENGVDGR